MVLVSAFDYGMASLGGFILSLACIINLLLKGRITGISGIFFGTITNMNFKQPHEFLWRFSFVIGMTFTSSLLRFSLPLETKLFDSPDKFLNELSLIGYFVSGLLVGFGTKLANGCTSGHGLNGLARLSKRSFLSVFLFLSFAIGIATLRYNYKFLNENQAMKIANDLYNTEFHLIFFGLFSFILFCIIIYMYIKSTWENILDIFISFLTGSFFAIGLTISGMNRRSKVINFLTIYENWDPSLMFVLFVGTGVNFFAFLIMKKYYEKPILAEKFGTPKKTDIDWRLVLGSIIFGLGWGISGICPGPLLVTFFIYVPHLIIFFVALVLGGFLCILLEIIIEKCSKKDNDIKEKDFEISEDEIQLIQTDRRQLNIENKNIIEKKNE